MNLRKLKVASLFSGAGGLDLGFCRAGHNVIWANDFDKDSCDTYRRNIGRHIVHADISQIDVGEIPSHDLLVGGFPCQGFSRANIHRVEKDERNNLYLHVIRILRLKQPSFFLLENVRGIKTLNNGRDFSEIILALEECGYVVTHETLNAADFGVPQNRIRVIIVGVRKNLAAEYEYRFPSASHSKDGKASNSGFLFPMP